MENRVMIIADLHFSDKYTGRHVDYFQNCVDVIFQITEEIKKNEVTHLFLLGDIVGLNEKNLKSRDSLLFMYQTFKKWEELTGNPVRSVRGNHDIGSKTTDFDFFNSMGVISNPSFVDVGSMRFHLINYGEERKELNTVLEQEDGTYKDKAGIDYPTEMYNFALMHANIQIEGKTNWFRAGAGYELSSLENLYGVEIVFCGHIHNPSPSYETTSIKDKDISLFYPGCLTRPKKEPVNWNNAFGVVLTEEGGEIDVALINFDLVPANELFQATYNEVDDDIYSDENIIDIDRLSEIMGELSKYNINSGVDYTSQINKFAGIDSEAAQKAMQYIEISEIEETE